MSVWKIVLFFVSISSIHIVNAQEDEIRRKFEGLDKLLNEKSFFGNHATGFMLYDMDSQLVIYEKNSHMNFIPASTVKLLTFYASLAVLKDSVNTFRFKSSGDEITIWGTGDPSWMQRKLPQPNIKEFLSPYKKIKFSYQNWNDEAFGLGWQWDDYYYAYSAEKSPFPIYGNVLTVNGQKSNRVVTPSYFGKALKISDKNVQGIKRDLHSNIFYHNPNTQSILNVQVPYITSPELFVTLAGEVLQKPLQLVNEKMTTGSQVFKGGKILPLWVEMLQESDNFIAEQLLLMVSDEILGEMNTGKVIEALSKTYLSDLPDMPQWVDGSGLSRYNLVTPRSMIGLLLKIESLLPRDQFIRILPQGGMNGTLKNQFKGQRPYVFAKTGTITNNNALVGIIKTDNDKYYAFAFMNNNYLNRASEIRKEMERVMIYIKENY